MTTCTLDSYWFLLRKFRNGIGLIQNLRRGGYSAQGPALARLIMRNGQTIVHPPNRAGLVPLMLQMWRDNVYRIGQFYSPAPGDIVVDVGAHIGLFTLQILWKQPRCRVIALEPCAENFACLKQNVALLGPDADVRIHQLGIGAEFGRVKIDSIPTNRSFDARTIPADEKDPAAVEVVPLDHVFRLTGTQTISLLKMDAEGAEYGAFSTAAAKLFSSIERIVLEYHENYVPGVLAMLQERLAPTHNLEIVPDPGQLHGLLFAVKKAKK